MAAIDYTCPFCGVRFFTASQYNEHLTLHDHDADNR